MIHSFDTDVAKLVGAEAAAVYNFIAACINYDPEVQTLDGLKYTNFTKKGIEQYFSYLSKWEIENAINRLVAERLVIKVNRIDPERPDFEYYATANPDKYDFAL